MRVAELMTTNPYGVQTRESIQHAAELMSEHNIGALPVFEDTRLAGIVTDRDIAIRAVARGAGAQESVDSVMSREPITIVPEASADEALQQMVRYGIGRLCVMNGDQVQGIITFSDLSPLTQLVADGLARKQSAQALTGRP
jgi:CBS domain-containing protein